jgi:hypothetical protein
MGSADDSRPQRDLAVVEPMPGSRSTGQGTTRSSTKHACGQPGRSFHDAPGQVGVHSPAAVLDWRVGAHHLPVQTD